MAVMGLCSLDGQTQDPGFIPFSACRSPGLDLDEAVEVLIQLDLQLASGEVAPHVALPAIGPPSSAVLHLDRRGNWVFLEQKTPLPFYSGGFDQQGDGSTGT
jgi:hypothetical protein